MIDCFCCCFFFFFLLYPNLNFASVVLGHILKMKKLYFHTNPGFHSKMKNFCLLSGKAGGYLYQSEQSIFLPYSAPCPQSAAAVNEHHSNADRVHGKL